MVRDARRAVTSAATAPPLILRLEPHLVQHVLSLLEHTAPEQLATSAAASELARWLSACERVHPEWRELLRARAGPCHDMWARVCRAEFPWARHPGKHVRWRRGL